jgi:hypothetical protein
MPWSSGRNSPHRWRFLPLSSTQPIHRATARIRIVWQRRTGSRIPLNRPGLVLAGVLASGTPTEILSPAFDVVKFRQSVVFCASPAQTDRLILVNEKEPSSARYFSLADGRIVGFCLSEIYENEQSRPLPAISTETILYWRGAVGDAGSR